MNNINGSGPYNNGNDDKRAGNGKNEGDDSVIQFPSAKERRKIEKEKLKQERIWREEYKKQKQAGKESFFTARARNIPPFTKYSIILMLLIQLVLTLIPQEQRMEIVYNLGFIPGIYTGQAPLTIFALISPFTSIMIHGGWVHVGFNAFMMLIMGMFFENSFGFKRTLQFFIICGLAGNLLYFILNPFSLNPVIGASGALNGFFAIFLIFNISMLPPQISNKGASRLILIWAAIIILLGLIQSGTAWQSHLGGLLSGWAIYELWKRRKIKAH